MFIRFARNVLHEMATARHGRERVVSQLEGSECSYCEEGELEQDTYKGSTAVVCGNCDVPQVRFT